MKKKKTIYRSIDAPWLVDDIIVIPEPEQKEKEEIDNGFKNISIPLVRRIYPQLLASKIVEVQPMTEPTGLIYYLRYKYSQNQGTKCSSELSEEC